MRAVGHLEAGLESRVEQGVAVRCLCCVDADQIRVLLQHLLLNGCPLAALLAIQTQYPVQTAVQLNDVPTAGLRMQCVDVLGDQSCDSVFSLQRSQGPVRCIGLCRADPRPAEHSACPVALARCRVAKKFLIHHRLLAAPHAILVAVVRNAGCGADACAGHHQKRFVGHRLA